MSTTDNAATIAAVASSIQTVGEARAALGKVADLLQQGYAQVGGIGSSITHDYTPIGLAEDKAGGVDELKAAAISRLDTVNAYAQRIYATFSNDDADQADQIGVLDASRVGLCLSQAQDALKDVETVRGQDLWNISELLSDSLVGAAHLAGTTAGSILQTAGNAAAAAGSSIFKEAWPVLLALGGAAILYVFRAPLLRAVGKAAA